MLLPGAFGLFFVLVLLLAVVPFGFWIYALVDAARAPEPAFGPPWDNVKNAWLLGLAVSAVIPAGVLVTTVLWFVQARRALREGAPVPRPFWAPRSVSYPPPGYVPPPVAPPDAPRDRPSE